LYKLGGGGNINLLGFWARMPTEPDLFFGGGRGRERRDRIEDWCDTYNSHTKMPSLKKRSQKTNF
jgi:hypothetical protein